MPAILLTLALALAPALAQEADPEAPTAADTLREREAQLLDAVRAFDPERHAELLRLKETDRRAYVAAMLRIARFVDRAAPGLRDPAVATELAKLDALRDRYPGGFDALSPPERKRVTAEVTTVAERLFDLRQAERRARIEALRTDLDALVADVARRDGEREALVRRFVEAFLAGRPDL